MPVSSTVSRSRSMPASGPSLPFGSEVRTLARIDMRSPVIFAATLSAAPLTRLDSSLNASDATSPADSDWNTGPRGWLSLSNACRVRSAPASVTGCQFEAAATTGGCERNRSGSHRSRVNHAHTPRMARRTRQPSRAMHPMDQSLRSAADASIRYVGLGAARSLCMKSIERTMKSLRYSVFFAVRRKRRKRSSGRACLTRARVRWGRNARPSTSNPNRSQATSTSWCSSSSRGSCTTPIHTTRARRKFGNAPTPPTVNSNSRCRPATPASAAWISSTRSAGCSRGT